MDAFQSSGVMGAVIDKLHQYRNELNCELSHILSLEKKQFYRNHPAFVKFKSQYADNYYEAMSGVLSLCPRVFGFDNGAVMLVFRRRGPMMYEERPLMTDSSNALFWSKNRVCIARSDWVDAALRTEGICVTNIGLQLKDGVWRRGRVVYKSRDGVDIPYLEQNELAFEKAPRNFVETWFEAVGDVSGALWEDGVPKRFSLERFQF